MTLFTASLNGMSSILSKVYCMAFLRKVNIEMIITLFDFQRLAAEKIWVLQEHRRQRFLAGP